MFIKYPPEQQNLTHFNNRENKKCHVVNVTQKCFTGIDLSHWGRETHICVGILTIIGSDNGLAPVRRQAIIWSNDGFLSFEPLRTSFSEIVIGIHTFSFKKMCFKMSSGKRRPFCLGLVSHSFPDWCLTHWLSNERVIILQLIFLNNSVDGTYSNLRLVHIKLIYSNNRNNNQNNWSNSQIPQCTCSIFHNASFRTEMYTFLFWMVHCVIWNRCIVGFVRFSGLFIESSVVMYGCESKLVYH